jgi:hypothetical protein
LRIAGGGFRFDRCGYRLAGAPLNRHGVAFPPQSGS